MIWTFRRGALGVAINALVAIAGAILVPVISFIIMPPSNGADRHEAPGRLLLAALGALVALAVAHAVWTWRAHQTRAAATR
jgi:multisubunit Na+/H+ antiporter MnhB subunit